MVKKVESGRLGDLTTVKRVLLLSPCPTETLEHAAVASEQPDHL